MLVFCWNLTLESFILDTWKTEKLKKKKSMHAALTVPAAVERCHGGGDVTAVTKFFFFFLELDELSVAVLKRNTTLPVASHSLSTTK